MPTIEENLERIADAVERVARNTGHLGRIAGPDATAAEPDTGEDDTGAEDTGEEETEEVEAKPAKKPAGKKPAAAKKADKKKDGPTKEDVRNRLQDYMAIEGRDEAINLLKEHADGAENLSQVGEDYYQHVIDAIDEAMG